MNVFMGYNPTVAKQVKVSVWVKEIDGAEPIFPATPKDGDCFIVFDTDDDVLADNPSSKKSYANGSWGDAGGGGGSGVVIPEVALTQSEDSTTWTSDASYSDMLSAIDNSSHSDERRGKTIPVWIYGVGYTSLYKSVDEGEEEATGLKFVINGVTVVLHEDGTANMGDK